MKPPLLLVGFPSWKDDYVKSTLLLSTELAREYNLLYVEYPYTWKDVVMGSLSRSDRPVKRILGWENRIRRINTYHGRDLHVLTLPPLLPANWVNKEELFIQLSWMNAMRARKAILKALRRLEMRNPIMVNAFNPFLGYFLHGTMGESLSVYYCYDEIGHARWAGKYGKLLENELLPKVDGLICSSQPLLEARRKLQPRSFLVKNGVYMDNFSLAIESRKLLTERKKCLGYWGVIDDRMDLDLLERMLVFFPDINLLLVGPIRENVTKHSLFSHPRIQLPGSQAPQSLHHWASQMDIALIPFVKNGFTQGIYPMKINEYLASGLPVVSTDFGDLSDFEAVIEIGKNGDEFLEKIGQLLGKNFEEGLASRLSLAESNSWEERGKTFVHILNELQKGLVPSLIKN